MFDREIKNPVVNDIYTDNWNFSCYILEKNSDKYLVLSRINPDFFSLEELTIEEFRNKLSLPNGKPWCYYCGNDPVMVKEKVSQYLGKFTKDEIRQVRLNCLLK